MDMSPRVIVRFQWNINAIIREEVKRADAELRACCTEWAESLSVEHGPILFGNCWNSESRERQLDGLVFVPRRRSLPRCDVRSYRVYPRNARSSSAGVAQTAWRRTTCRPVGSRCGGLPRVAAGSMEGHPMALGTVYPKRRFSIGSSPCGLTHADRESRNEPMS